MRKTKLGGNEWLEMWQVFHDDLSPQGYTYSHEVKGNGHKVAILPFRLNPDGSGILGVEWLLLNEITLCWNGDTLEPHSVTGTLEEGKSHLEMARIELAEETGYDVKEEDLIYLGDCYGAKSCDSVYHLYSVNLTDVEKGEASGDGSAFEKVAEPFWTINVGLSTDPLAYVMQYKALNHMFEEGII